MADERGILVDWLSRQTGKGMRYTSARQLSLAAKLSPNVVSNVLESGRADLGTWVAIARVKDIPNPIHPLRMLVMLGVLEDADIEGFVPGLEREENQLIQAYRDLSPESKQMILSGVQAGQRFAQEQAQEAGKASARRRAGSGRP